MSGAQRMDPEVYAVVRQLVGDTGVPGDPRPYLSADFESHPEMAAAVYVFADLRARVRYVGSVVRTGGRAARRVREHLRDRAREREWIYVWFIPFGRSIPAEHVRLMERLVGERLQPLDNRRLPGIQKSA